jgi:hypothetical protein
MNLNSGDKPAATTFIKEGISQSLWVVRILLSIIKAIKIGITGAREKPRIFDKMFMLRRLKLPPSANIVPASAIIIIIVRIMPAKNGFLRLVFSTALEYNITIRKTSAAMSIAYVAMYIRFCSSFDIRFSAVLTPGLNGCWIEC